MNKKDLFFKQPVAEDEWDEINDLIEQADHNLALDIGVFGIISGLVAVEHFTPADLTIDLSAPGKAYDQLGQRVFVGSGQNVDCSVDYLGVPTTVGAAPNEKQLGVYIKFDRLLSNPRTDGNGATVYYDMDESFEFVVRQGAEAPLGTSTPPPLQPDEILICDILLIFGQTQILNADISTTRRQDWVFTTADNIEVVSGAWSVLAPATDDVQASLDDVDDELDTHYDGTGVRHTSADVDHVPHDFIAATDLQAAFEELIDDLESQSVPAGASRIGGAIHPGSPNALTATTLGLQIDELLDHLNEHENETTGAHAASAISKSTTPNWENGSPPSGSTVEAIINNIVTNLADNSGADGARRIGADAQTSGVASVSQGSIKEQMLEVLSMLAARALLAGGNTFTGTQVFSNLVQLDGEVDVASKIDLTTGYIEAPGAAGYNLIVEAGTGTRKTRIYFNGGGEIWITVNAAILSGVTATKDISSSFAAALVFTRQRFELYFRTSAAGTFDVSTVDSGVTGWHRRLMLNLSSWEWEVDGDQSTMPALEQGEDVGYWAVYVYNNNAGASAMFGGTGVNFKNILDAAPSSISFSGTSNSNCDDNGDPSVAGITKYGFMAYESITSLGAGLTAWKRGTYTTVA